MYFHVQLIDNPENPKQREKSRLDHWQYFDDHRECFIARGATVSDDDERLLSSVLFVEFDDWEQVWTFVDNEPHNKNGVYGEVHIKQWGFALKRRQVPEDLVGALLFLASSDSDFMTGQCVVIDGGSVNH